MNQSVDRHIWQFRWVRDLLIVAVAFLILLVAYKARSIVAPALLGLVLAYAAHPLLTWMTHRWRMSRTAATLSLMGALILTTAIVMVLLLPKIVGQLAALIRRTAEYVGWLAERTAPQWQPYLEMLGAKVAAFRGQAAAEEKAQSASPQESAPLGHEPAVTVQPGPTSTPSPADLPAGDDGTAAIAGWENVYQNLSGVNFQALGAALLSMLDVGLSFAGSTIGLIGYSLLFLLLTAFCFYYFSVQLPAIRDACASLIPITIRPRAIDLANKMDVCIAAFIRGRLLQAAVMAVTLSIGWWMVGVPYWLLLGLAGGLLNLAPFVAVLAWIAALALTSVDQLSTGGGWSIGMILWPTVVYAIAQALDGWVVEPVVQGKATNLDPLTVLLAVLVGGSLAGMLGLILAIPVAACIRIVARDVVLPTYQKWAEDPRGQGWEPPGSPQ